MPWAGGIFIRTNGTYTGSTVWQSDAAAAVKIRADRHDTHDQDIGQGVNNCLAKDGQNSPTQNISWGTFKIINLGDGSAAQDAATVNQVVLKTGSTMTGALNLPTNGLVVGTSQLVTTSLGIGVGTASPLAFVGRTVHVHNTASGGSSIKVTDADTGSTADDGFEFATAGGGVGYIVQREAQPINITFGSSNVGVFNSFGLSINTTAATADEAFKVAGRVSSSGSVASMNFQDRAGGSATFWAWYSSGTIARLNHDPEGDRITVDASGNLASVGAITAGTNISASGNIVATGNITVGGGKKLSKITLSTSAPGALADGELYLRY